MTTNPPVPATTPDPMPIAPLPRVAVVIGARGGLGGALARRLTADARYGRMLALSRQGPTADAATPGERVVHGRLDLLDESSIAQAAGIARALGEVRLVIVASGVLHDASGLSPEKHWDALNAQSLAHVFAINAIGPALVAKHFLPLMPRNERSVFAALSARVGSIEDNRAGGWYGYRASKAGLNMLIRTLSIELARRAPQALCIGLHPGTVDTALSHPFQAGVPPHQLFSPERAAEHLLRVIEGATVEDSGRVLAWDGQRVPA